MNSLLKKRIPLTIFQRYLEIYEQEELMLEKTEHYECLKRDILANKRVKLQQFEKFINETRISPYTKLIHGKNFVMLNRGKNKQQVISDIKFGICLYYAFKIFTRHIVDNIIQDITSKQEYKYIILDLRGNRGGAFEACIDLCDLFICNKEIVKLYFKSNSKSYYASDKYVEFRKIYIIVDQNTASSSEIFTLSLKINCENVIILGTETFKKGIGQTNYTNKKYKLIFRLSTYKWLVNGKDVNDLCSYIQQIDQKYENELYHILYDIEKDTM